MKLYVVYISILCFTTTVLQASQTSLQNALQATDSQDSNVSPTPTYPNTSPLEFRPASASDTSQNLTLRKKKFSKRRSYFTPQNEQPNNFWNFENKLLLWCATAATAVFYVQGITPFK